MTKDKNQKQQNDTTEFEQRIGELTLDLQRTRADFENYRKRTEADKISSYQNGQAAAILKLLPVVDNIDRALAHVPEELADNAWAKGIQGLSKNLDKSLEGLKLKRIETKPGDEFNPEIHEAIQVDEDATGAKEVIAEVLQSGYTLDDQPIRHAMVKVTRTDDK